MTEEEITETHEEQGTTEILTNGPVTNDRIFDLLFKEEDIAWQTILYELVRTNQMDPWDIDISLLTKSFIEMIKKLKEMDFRISGKIVLASAILLKIKSNRFVVDDINAFDNLIHPPEASDDDYLEDADGYLEMAEGQLNKKDSLPSLFPRTPQPRKRKVSIFDLVKALEKALDVKNRRVERVDTAPIVHVPKQHREISLVIKEVYDQIKKFFSKENNLTFTQLLPSDDKEDKVYTFIPLLHLRNQQKVDLHQQVHFGEINIELMKEGKAEE